jgi:methyl-accepting chemotaxis protein|uniref:Methyl-accepting transducer domain-containing protein n=1 Tax=Gracilinema caldarium TaxID=215591 RepID=A0A7C3E202_9SPIR
MSSELNHDRVRDILVSCQNVCAQILAQYDEESEREHIITQLQGELSHLGSLSKQILDNAQQIYGISENLAGSAEKGFNLSQQVQARVTALADIIKTSVDDTNRLQNQSEKINEILSIMSEISSTTNVLSINASIVAARYGARGKEFDVVAREIRKLSEGTERSLKDITVLVNEVKNSISSVSTKLQKVNQEILNQNESILSVAGALQGVTLAVEVIRSVTTLSKETAEAEIQTFKTIEESLIRLASCTTTPIPKDQVQDLHQNIADIISQ